jgi:Flp pilus assembly protein TadG
MLSLRRLFRRQRGVSYSLSFVLVVPIFLTVMLFTVEAGLLLVTRLTVQYAAHQAARAAVVWQSAEPHELADERIKQAAVQSIAPGMGGRQRELDDAGPVPAEARKHATDWAEAVRRYQVPAVAAEPGLRRPYSRPYTPPAADFLERKYLSAWARTTVIRHPPATDHPHGPLTVTVKLRAPLYIPVVSRFLDGDGKPPFEYPLEATATLPNDAPVSDDGTLGIDYRSFQK